MRKCASCIGADKIMTTAALGLGGNIGDPQAAMAEALQGLDSRDDCTVSAVSRLYKTPPWGKTDQPDFLNCCALVETSLGPEALLDVCLSVERSMKRERVERWGPRTIDIDILTFGNREMETERLALPHPRMVERAFVLVPLAEIAPEMVVSGQSLSEWLRRTDSSGIHPASKNQNWWRER